MVKTRPLFIPNSKKNAKPNIALWRVSENSGTLPFSLLSYDAFCFPNWFKVRVKATPCLSFFATCAFLLSQAACGRSSICICFQKPVKYTLKLLRGKAWVFCTTHILISSLSNGFNFLCRFASSMMWRRSFL